MVKHTSLVNSFSDNTKYIFKLNFKKNRVCDTFIVIIVVVVVFSHTC